MESEKKWHFLAAVIEPIWVQVHVAIWHGSIMVCELEHQPLLSLVELTPDKATMLCVPNFFFSPHLGSSDAMGSNTRHELQGSLHL